MPNLPESVESVALALLLLILAEGEPIQRPRDLLDLYGKCRDAVASHDVPEADRWAVCH